MSETDKAIHTGHRKRMKARYREEGLEGFADHEVLELLLFYGKARGDVNPTAHALLDTFGSLKGVLEASPAQLMQVSGVGEDTATLLSLMLPLFRRYSRDAAKEKPCLSSRAEAERYCRSLLTGLRTEHFYVLCLDANFRLLGRRLVAEGSLSEVAAYPRTVMEAALSQNAHGVLLCHNHPGGRASPSGEDIEVTRRLQRVLSEIGVVLLDHLIVAGDACYSMVQHGELLLPEE